jgi:hypothetical protein
MPEIIDRQPHLGTGWVQRGMRSGISDSCLVIGPDPVAR